MARTANSRAAKRARGYVIALLKGGSVQITGNPGSPAVGGNAAFTPVITGGVAPYTLTLGSGTLPPGRAITGASETGTYTTAGTYNYVLHVADSAGHTANLAVTATVAPAGSPNGSLDFSDAGGTGLGVGAGVL